MQKHILIIDDDPAVVESLTAALCPPYSVSAASDTRSALAFLEREWTNLILLDLMLGAEDGVALLPRLRRLTPAPILVLTAFGSRENLVRLMSVRPDGFLEKPVSVQELHSRVAAFLDVRPEGDPMTRVRDWMAREFHRPLTIKDCARVAGMSLAHFCRHFFKRFGLAPLAYLERCRMQQAATLLRDTKDSIKEVAGQIGYGRANNFSTAFRRVHGCTPKAFRNEGESPWPNNPDRHGDD